MSFASLYSQEPSAVAGIRGGWSLRCVCGRKERRNEREREDIKKEGRKEGKEAGKEEARKKGRAKKRKLIKEGQRTKKPEDIENK